MVSSSRTTLVFFGSLILVTGIAIADWLTGDDTVLLSLLAVGPLVAVAHFRLWETNIVGAYSLSMAVVLGFPNHIYGSTDHVLRCISILAVSALATTLTHVRLQVERQREKVIVELQEALAEVKQLSGLLPLCAWCNKVRDDEGYYHDLQSYITRHSQVQFTHGICLECRAKFLSEAAETDDEALA
jgi:hypothetical protein